MASGVFDLIHIGHVHYLEEAKSYGDELVVVIACDETVRNYKHEPIMPAEDRRRIVEALKPVDIAVVGHEDDMLKIVEELKPNIIALGYDQHAKGLEQKLYARGIVAQIVICKKYDGDLTRTRKIIEKIKSRRGLYDSEADRDC